MLYISRVIPALQRPVTAKSTCVSAPRCYYCPLQPPARAIRFFPLKANVAGDYGHTPLKRAALCASATQTRTCCSPAWPIDKALWYCRCFIVTPCLRVSWIISEYSENTGGFGVQSACAGVLWARNRGA